MTDVKDNLDCVCNINSFMNYNESYVQHVHES